MIATAQEQYLDFSPAEYQSRVRKAQKSMKAEGLDGLLLTQFENIAYFSGYITWLIRVSKHRPSICLLPAEGDPVLVIPELELPAARLVSPVVDMRGWSTTYVDMWADALRELRIDGGVIGAELGEESNLGMPIRDWDALRARVPRVRFQDALDLVYALRSVKSPKEAQYMREAGRIAGTAAEAAWDLLRSRKKVAREVTENDVAATMGARMMEEGALVPGFINVRSGAQQGMMHNKYATNRVIQDGDWVAMDYGAIYKNYNSDTIRVGSYGSPRPEWARYYELQLDIARKVREATRPGVTVKELCQIKIDECMRNGLELPWAGIGHCIGLSVHELPRINPEVDLVLEAGMCFTVEPGFSADGNTFCIEDVVMVTETGHELFTTYPGELVVV